MWKLSRHILELSFAKLRTKNAGNHLQWDIYLKVKLNADLCNVCDGTAYLCDSEVLEGEGPKVKVAHRRLEGYDVLGSPGSILLTYSRYSTRYHVYRNIFISWNIVNSSHWGTWGNVMIGTMWKCTRTCFLQRAGSAIAILRLLTFLLCEHMGFFLWELPFIN